MRLLCDFATYVLQLLSLNKMILPIYLYGQPVLRKPTEDITLDSLDLNQLLADMWETLAVAEGCGLAAPQIGKAIRLFIVDGTELAEDYPECQDFKKVFINPEIIDESEDDATFTEGCLSLPGISENVIRPASITIRYMDENFTEHTETYEGFAARIIQHEYDHLEGHVFTDRISPIRRQFVKSKLTNIAKGKVTARYRTKR
jgi:peptide deformylase